MHTIESGSMAVGDRWAIGETMEAALAELISLVEMFRIGGGCAFLPDM